MTKKEIIDKLVNDYGVDLKGLNKKTVIELEELLHRYSRVDVNDVLDKNIEDEVTIEEINKEVDDTVYENEFKLQLSVYETVVRRFEPSKNVKLKNLGAGDLYVSNLKDNLIRVENLIRPNECKDFNSVEVLYMTSASRPIVQINYSN